jgi:proteasome lid subunit RPN8/RPN11
MAEDVARQAPLEACGLLAGDIQGEGYAAQTATSITNKLHSPTRFRMEPYEQLAAFNQMEAQDQELVGIYHSHPRGPDEPSVTDIAEAYYPEAVYLIWSCTAEEWICRAFTIQQGEVRPVRLVILES